jgi:methylmalonyl-CoA epimerase
VTAVTRIHHIGVVVRSIDDAFAFFRDALGLPLLKEEAVEEQGVRAALLDLGGPALSEVEGSFLELLQPTVPDTGIARYLERRGEGLHHVCLEVPDIDAALAGLKADGVPLVDEVPRAGITGTIAFLHPSALHGVLVELVHGPTAFRRPALRALDEPGVTEVQGAKPPAGGFGGSPPDSITNPSGRAGGSDKQKVIERLDHLIIAVQQLHDAADAWARVLGLQADAPYHPESSHLELARLPLSDRAEGGAYLELAQPTTADHRVARFIAERGEGMFSVSLEVAALDAAVRDLRARGLPVSEPEPGAWPGTRLARIPRASAHGVAVQLIERSMTS